MILETQRLILRPLNENDIDRMFLLDSNPNVMKYLGKKIACDKSESESLIKFVIQQYNDNGLGRLAVIEKESGLLIGWSGLKLQKEPINNHTNHYDLGYRFLPEYWGKGYATEAGKASLDFGFNELKAEIIYAYAHSENESSNWVLEQKLGFTKTEEFEEPDGICNWYELKKENFSK